MRVLIIEDEKYLAEALEHILKKNNYSVDVSLDGLSGYENALSDIYDVLIVDLMIPKIDGMTLINKLRKESIETPIIILSAKSDLSDKVNGLDIGADDYLTKPFETEELLARIKSLTRRKHKKIENDIITYKDISYDKNKLILFNNKKSYQLTLKESQLLYLLISNNEKIITKEMIIDKLWGYEDIVDNNVEVYISFLRKKLNDLNTNVIIKTIRNVGYVLKEK